MTFLLQNRLDAINVMKIVAINTKPQQQSSDKKRILNRIRDGE